MSARAPKDREQKDMGDAFRDWPVLDKPFNFAQLTKVLTTLLAPSASGTPALAV